jgi:hypothetical protein
MSAMAADCCDVGKAMIDELPDDVLLDIFDFYLDSDHKGPYGPYQDFDAWHTLVHVCRKWRNVVFASPRRLNLRLVCRKRRSVRDMLDIWPALPINIEHVVGPGREMGLDNIVAALGHRDRVRSINLGGQQWQTLVAAVQAPFPELAYLELSSVGVPPALSDSFLGGSAPLLRTLRLTKISFPALPNLLLSASDLVDLKLHNIPYIPPASMVACLSSLNKLTSFSLGFDSPQSRPDQPSPPSQSRVVLPVLTKLAFDGTSEYSEDLVARIDTPVLNQLHITFFPKPIFDVPHLKQFINGAKGFKPSKAAELRFSPWTTHVDLQQPCSSSLGVRHYGFQVSSLTLLCGQFSYLFSLVERLDLQSSRTPDDRLRVVTLVMPNLFLKIFQLFTATRSLHVSKEFVPPIVSALQELIGAREVLPNLRGLFLEGSAKMVSIMKVMEPFVDARRLSGQPVAVHLYYLD